MNHDTKELRDYPHDVAALRGGLLARRGAAGRSIARLLKSRALTPDAPGERQLAPRDALQRAPADVFREIRTRLLALGGNENFVTLVASVSPGSGGSYVTRNIARAFAFDEAKAALLVDCNLNNPVQHYALGVDPVHGGLLDFLEQPNRSAQQILYSTGIPRVALVPAGARREASVEYFSSFRMRALIESMRSRQPERYLFLDGPALKGSPDARILSDLADFIVIVAAYARDSATSINQAVASLDPKKVAGVVFNYPP